jgi:thioredoxin reductase
MMDAPEWPYAIRYDQEQQIETDVLVIGGGIAGCWAAISAARKGVRVALVERLLQPRFIENHMPAGCH